jgi:MFS family permease
MTVGTTATDGLSATTEPSVAEDRTSPLNEVLRDITRGGLAGLIVGIVLAGLGGRLVMRLAAMLVPAAAGSLTENGNVIGTITVGGSVALIVFVGLLFGAVVGSLWVVISPWLPDAPALRAVVSIPIAVALGTRGLVDDHNPDFNILGRDPVVIGSLVVLVALFGPALVLVDRWLDRHLPHPGPGDAKILTGYTLVTALGTLLTMLVVVPLYLGSDLLLAGLSLLVVGIATLASWWFRIECRPALPLLPPVARAALVVATISGLVVATSEVVGALGLG